MRERETGDRREVREKPGSVASHLHTDGDQTHTGVYALARNGIRDRAVQGKMLQTLLSHLGCTGQSSLAFSFCTMSVASVCVGACCLFFFLAQ